MKPTYNVAKKRMLKELQQDHTHTTIWECLKKHTKVFESGLRIGNNHHGKVNHY